ncbi:MAG: sulfatase-like hydrolase/transferase [Planctomycetaceae bacterium]|nr:sulfatase-like hydrolase/transferase [Planctomycetaceae bacterium]
MFTRYSVVVILLLTLAVCTTNVLSQEQKEQEFRYETNIVDFEKKTTENPLPENCTLFVGSSIWRLWGERLEKDFAEFNAVNRGFGGATVPDVLHVMHRIITPHKPARIVFFCGGNDIARGATSEETFENFKTFLSRLHAESPDTEVFFVSVILAPVREGVHKQTRQYNAFVKELAEKTPKLHYIETTASLAGEDGKADEKYFRNDRLHLNRDGQKQWIPVIKKALREADSAHPNVVIILADDQGWGDVSVHGNTNLKTPNIDSLAAQGATFDRFFVCPLCSPTRAEFLTGRYHLRSNVFGVTMGRERMSLEETTVADMFLAAGYSTAMFGKWHNGSQYPYHPTARGFQEFFGFTTGYWGNYFDPVLENNGKIIREKGYITDILTDKTIQYIENNKDKPFFCYLALNTPHSPWMVPDEYWDRFKDDPIALRGRTGENEELPKTRCALAMCENIDWNVGRIIKKLDELHLDNNTIVIYFSDNGPNSTRWNGDMKGRKASVEEGGVRVPFFIRWTGTIPAETSVSQIAGGIDLLPTLAKLANIPQIGTLPLDGVDVSPLLFGKNDNWSDRTIVSQNGTRLAVRSQQYRYVAEDDQLFDMIADPGQRKNIAEKRPEVLKRFVQTLEDWKESTRYNVEREVVPIPVGYSEYPWTPLPSRDAEFAGNVRRSVATISSYVTDWISPEDKISWYIDVHTDGDYIAKIHYTCSESDVGSQLEIRCGDGILHAKITEPFDPPFYDQWDRVPRHESYMKDFKEMTLGTILLKKGVRSLELSAPQVAGKQVADFWFISLTLDKESQ